MHQPAPLNCPEPLADAHRAHALPSVQRHGVRLVCGARILEPVTSVVAPHLNLWETTAWLRTGRGVGRTDLQTLVLAENALAEMPECIGRLTRLRMLDLGHNHLTRLPDALGDLNSECLHGTTDPLLYAPVRSRLLLLRWHPFQNVAWLHAKERAQLIESGNVQAGSAVMVQARDNRVAEAGTPGYVLNAQPPLSH